MQQKSVNIGGKLMDLSKPKVMAIVNVTTDSFAQHCTNITEAEILRFAAKALQEGADILDLGACSTRPGAPEVPEQEEWRRLHLALSAVRREWPEAIVSVDTYRASIARQAAQDFQIDLVNDISGGQFDPQMFPTMAQLRIPYILTHTRAKPQEMQLHTQYENLMSELLAYFQSRVDELHRIGVKDVIIDPGFGFSKTLEQNYEILRKLRYLSVLGLPILAGISRKRMIYEALGTSPDEALNGTTALHILALQNGASILRVHDVKQAKEVIKLYSLYHGI